MTPFESELRFLQESLPQLQDYLLSNELYWPLSGALPRLTPGAMLLATRRLGASSLAGQAAPLAQQAEAMHAKWRGAWEKKAAREVSNRARLWSQFLSDFANDQDKNLVTYKTEARSRAILQLLLDEQPGLPEKSALGEMDGLLRSFLKPGGFIWETELESAFPKADYWFLYGNLP